MWWDALCFKRFYTSRELLEKPEQASCWDLPCSDASKRDRPLTGTGLLTEVLGDVHFASRWLKDLINAGLNYSHQMWLKWSVFCPDQYRQTIKQAGLKLYCLRKMTVSRKRYTELVISAIGFQKHEKSILTCSVSGLWSYISPWAVIWDQTVPLVCGEAEVTTDAIDPHQSGIINDRIPANLSDRSPACLPEERKSLTLPAVSERSFRIPLWCTYCRVAVSIFNRPIHACSSVSGWCIKIKMGATDLLSAPLRSLPVLFPPPHVTDALIRCSLSLSLTPSLKAH